MHLQIADPAPGEDPSDPGEDAVVRRIAAVFEAETGRGPSGEVWIGDDAAVVSPYDGRVVLATDAAVAGVHSDLSLVGLDDLGWKALTATVSDIAAMGARPAHALVCFCAPGGTDLALLASGAALAGARWSCPVVGGDVTASLQVVVCAAVTGVLDADDPPVLRSGAAPGDAIFVTGALGGSAGGLRTLRAGGATDDDAAALVLTHRRPEARVREGALARASGSSAMIDVSDGLAIDLHRLAEASGVGVVVDEVPVVPGATEDEALSGGEDYELIVAVPDPARLLRAFRAGGLREPLEIGRCTADPTERKLRGGPLPRVGYLHSFG